MITTLRWRRTGQLTPPRCRPEVWGATRLCVTCTSPLRVRVHLQVLALVWTCVWNSLSATPRAKLGRALLLTGDGRGHLAFLCQPSGRGVLLPTPPWTFEKRRTQLACGSCNLRPSHGTHQRHASLRLIHTPSKARSSSTDPGARSELWPTLREAICLHCPAPGPATSLRQEGSPSVAVRCHDVLSPSPRGSCRLRQHVTWQMKTSRLISAGSLWEGLQGDGTCRAATQPELQLATSQPEQSNKGLAEWSSGAHSRLKPTTAATMVQAALDRVSLGNARGRSGSAHTLAQQGPHVAAPGCVHEREEAAGRQLGSGRGLLGRACVQPAASVHS